jgi:plastocyanin
MKHLIFFSLIGSCLLMTTCSKKPKGSPGQNEIWLEYKLFQPSQLTVQKGTTVTFTNKDNANHSATNINGLFDSGKISSGDSWSYTFDKTGSIGFYCKYHSSNTSEQGYIIVE